MNGGSEVEVEVVEVETRSRFRLPGILGILHPADRFRLLLTVLSVLTDIAIIPALPHRQAGWPNGKALDYESRDCRFDPCVGHFLVFLFLIFCLLYFIQLRSSFIQFTFLFFIPC